MLFPPLNHFNRPGLICQVMMLLRWLPALDPFIVDMLLQSIEDDQTNADDDGDQEDQHISFLLIERNHLRNSSCWFD